MGQTLNGASGLDIDAEKKVVEEILKQLFAQNNSHEDVTLAMKNFGIQRFNHFHVLVSKLIFYWINQSLKFLKFDN